jgi:hypothetical protein
MHPSREADLRIMSKPIVEFIDTFRRVEELFGQPHQWYYGMTGKPGRSREDHDLCPRSEPGLITRQTPVATIGSCFAHEIRHWLIENGYNFLQTEPGLPGMPNFDCGSANYGPVYNTACMRQIFEAAYGLFDPAEKFWRVGDKLADPFRRGIGWPDEAARGAELARHHAAVRRVAEESRVLIATAGLAEVWRSREDGATFFMVPPAEVFDPERHECVMTSVSENVENLERLYTLLRAKNPALRLMMTVSPVPMMATPTDQSGVVVDCVSKATLRIAVDSFCRNHPEVVYFPAYEYVKRIAVAAFEADHRHVRREVVAEIMSLFRRKFGEPASAALEAKPAVVLRKAG